MSMNATLESNVQIAGDRAIVGEHALSRQQAAVFDTLDPRPDIPWSQSNRGSLSHPTIRSGAAAIGLHDLTSVRYEPAVNGLLPHLPHPGGHVDPY